MCRATFCLGLLLAVLVSGGLAEGIPWCGEQGDAVLTYESQGSWFDGMNWGNYAVPTSADHAIFDPQYFAEPLPTPYSVYYGDYYKCVSMGGYSHLVAGGSAEAASIDIAGHHWIFDFDFFDPNHDLNETTGSLTVSGNLNVGTTADYSSASLEITGEGSLLCYAAVLGGPEDTSGIMTVDHTSMVLDEGGLFVGDNGRGTLDVVGGEISAFSPVHIGYASGGVGSVTVDGGDSFLSACGQDVGWGWLSVGEYGSGYLHIADGGCTMNDNGRVGWFAGSSGTVLVEDSGSSWYCALDTRIGDEGTGVLTVRNGGEVDIDSWVGIGYGATGDGNATVTGAGSRWVIVGTLNVGGAGTGSLLVENGGGVEATFGFLGDSATGQGEVTVTGTDSSWTNSELLIVGNAGRGTLDVLDEGQVTAGELILGWGAGSHGEVLVSGTESELDNSGGTTVGCNAFGSLVVEGGGRVANTYAHIGNCETGQGEVTVTGTDSTWSNSDLLTVGNAGQGTLDVLAGGHVTAGEFIVGWATDSHGEATVDGSQSALENSGQTTVGYHAFGSLAVTGGGKTTCTFATLGKVQGSDGRATISGGGSRWMISDDLTVGADGQGTLSILNDGLVAVGGSLVIDNNGGNDSFINMTTGGMLAIFGDADDSLTEFLNLVRGTDAIRYWDHSVSDWAALAGALPGIDYTLAYVDAADSDLYGYTLLTVRTVSTVPGDANGDGRVDDLDASILAANWQRSSDATWATADFNGDGNVNDLDASILAANWQYGVGAAVPEPGTLALLAGLATVPLVRCIRRRGFRPITPA